MGLLNLRPLTSRDSLIFGASPCYSVVGRFELSQDRAFVWLRGSCCPATVCRHAPTVSASVSELSRCLWEATALHDAEELLLVDLTVAIAVSLVNHLLELLIGHVLSKLLGHTLQVLEGDLAGLIIVEETEHLHDLLAGITVAHTCGHHVKEFIEVDGAGAVLVDVVDHATDLILLGVEAEGAHGNLQLLGINGAGAIGIEQVECLTDLLDLVVGETLWLCWCATR